MHNSRQLPPKDLQENPAVNKVNSSVAVGSDFSGGRASVNIVIYTEMKHRHTNYNSDHGLRSMTIDLTSKYTCALVHNAMSIAF